jgi:peptidoglycan hydrolase-like protein with peptidoglycan-binding domain
MTIKVAPVAALLGLLTACQELTPQQTPEVTSAATATEITSEPLPAKDCYATEVTPAEYQYVMGQVQVVQAKIAADGTVLQPPVYRNQPVPREVKPRGELTFKAPCPTTVTPEFIASLQRALFARSYFEGRINGRLDKATMTAIGRYQRRHGLDSEQLSLKTARQLGILAVEIDRG